MSRMLEPERKRFNNQILNDEKDGWTFEVWEEKHHKCCVVCVVRKGGYIAREHRLATDLLLGLMGAWYKGIPWLEKERTEWLNG